MNNYCNFIIKDEEGLKFQKYISDAYKDYMSVVFLALDDFAKSRDIAIEQDLPNLVRGMSVLVDEGKDFTVCIDEKYFNLKDIIISYISKHAELDVKMDDERVNEFFDNELSSLVVEGISAEALQTIIKKFVLVAFAPKYAILSDLKYELPKQFVFELTVRLEAIANAYYLAIEKAINNETEGEGGQENE